MVLGNFFYVLRVEEESMSQSVQKSAKCGSCGQLLPVSVRCKFCGEAIPWGERNEQNRAKQVFSNTDCFGRLVLEEQEAWEYEQYLDGSVVYGREH